MSKQNESLIRDLIHNEFDTAETQCVGDRFILEETNHIIQERFPTLVFKDDGFQSLLDINGIVTLNNIIMHLRFKQSSAVIWVLDKETGKTKKSLTLNDPDDLIKRGANRRWGGKVDTEMQVDIANVAIALIEGILVINRG